MKHIFKLAAVVLLLGISSCEDFLNTIPKDQLVPSTTWKTPDDANKFLVGCYDGCFEGWIAMYWDSASDFGYNNFQWEGFKSIGNGSLTAGDTGQSFYDFTTVQRCNVFLKNIDNVEFTNDKQKKDMVAQVRIIRAYKYFVMNFLYGGVPIVEYYETADQAKGPRKTEAEVKAYVYKELDEATPDLNDAPAIRGRIAKGAALAIKMRAALCWGDYQLAKDAADAIVALKQYDLEPVYGDLFTLDGRDSKEIIVAAQQTPTTYANGTLGQFYNNSVGGWSSVVPTKNLIDLYEMADGQTKEESAAYDPVHPFKGRDPRMAMTVLFPGEEIDGTVVNTLDETIGGKTNADYPSAADNASKTGLTWYKYQYPMDQYPDVWDSGCSPIIFRYADVLLTLAETTNELSGPSSEVYGWLDKVRKRSGMPAVDRTKYANQETLRELIRRERSIELAGEGLRYFDILRWKDAAGKMVAETVRNGALMRWTGTVDATETDPFMRATMKVGGDELIENRSFKPYNRYLPIPQSNRDNNPELTQNPGY
jgi:hypothetical protein